MVIFPAGGHDSGGWIVGVGDLRLPPPEHSCAVYCNRDHYGSVSGGGAEAGVKGRKEVVEFQSQIIGKESIRLFP